MPRYKLAGTISLRNIAYTGPMEITREHTEIVEASFEEEALELSLTGFKDGEEPVWDTESLTITIVEEDSIADLKAELAQLEQSEEGHEERIEQLRLLISAHAENAAIIQSSGVTPDMDEAEYWNTIATAYDKAQGYYD